jgi:carbon monoxide dehydrogenase subunit G
VVGMASIHQHFRVDRDAESVWDALRDFGAVHERVAAGFVTATEIDGDVRTVTFVNGVVAREILVAVDDARRRLVYSVIESPLGLTHHQATVEVVPADVGGGCEFDWTTDVLPHEAAPTIEAMMAEGATAIERTLSP